MWLGWPSSVVEKFIKHETDFDVSIDQLSWIVALMDLGNVISPLFAGYLMDRIGRKMSTVILGPLFGVSWLLAVYVPTPAALYVARLMAGLGKGMSYTVVPVYLGELAGVQIRGALSSVFCLQLHAGFLLEAVIGPLVSYGTLNIVSAVVPAIFFAAIVWIPESPYYLLRRNRQPEAAKCLRWFRCEDNVDSELRLMETNVRKEMENQSTFREVFTSRKDRRALSIVVMACFSQRAGGISCILAYSALILPEPAPLMGKFEYIMLFATILVVVNMICVATVDAFGRRPMLITSELVMGVTTAIFAVYYYCYPPATAVPNYIRWLPYACHVSFALAFAVGVGFIPVVFLGEMFPVNIRSQCSAIASVTLALCSFVTNKMFLFVSHRYGYHAMFCGFTVVNIAGAIYSYRYAIETKGKTFLEIQQILEESVKKEVAVCKQKVDDNNDI